MILLLKRFWKEIAIILLISFFVGTMYFLYNRNISLNMSLQESQMALEASQADVEALKSAKVASDKALETNALRQAQISSNLERARSELDILKQQSEINNEKGSECINVDIPSSILERMRERAKQRGN